MREMPNISVIVPIYNSENSLTRCVESILNQTYADFELILVDDGSNDLSPVICDQFLERDDRVIVLHKANGGVSSARNVGLGKATGAWVVFVDSDDWVNESYLEDLILDSVGVDLVIGYAVVVNHPYDNELEIPNLVLQKDEYDFLFSSCFLSWRTSPWNKLFKREIIQQNKMCFNEGMKIGEDAVFLYEYLLYTHAIKVVDNRNYYYVYDSANSLTKRLNSLQDEMSTMESISKAIHMLIIKKELRSIDALSELYWLESTYIHRVLNSLYYTGVARRERLAVINKINIELYYSYFLLRQRTPYRLFLSFLLKNRLYKIYDLIRLLAKVIRHKLYQE